MERLRGQTPSTSTPSPSIFSLGGGGGEGGFAEQAMDEENMTKTEEQQPLSLQKALQQCELVQNMIDLSISNLEGLRTKCATSNDLTQKEIRTLEVGVAWGRGEQSCLPSLLPTTFFPSGCVRWGSGGGWVSQVGTDRCSVIYLLAEPALEVPLRCGCCLCSAGWW